MAKKGDKKAADQGDLATNIRLGTRVRHVEDGAEGRIVWANASAVKIQWDDAEKVTWKRAELGAKGLVVIDEEESPAPVPAVAPTLEPDAPAPAAEPDAAPAAEPEAAVTAKAEGAPASEAAQTEPGPTAERRAEPSPEPAPEASARKRTKPSKPAEPKPARPSALDAAARVLGEEMRPMGCQELIGRMAAKGYWTSPGGKTPSATLYSAILRELQTKGEEARFVKVGKGQFALRKQA